MHQEKWSRSSLLGIQPMTYLVNLIYPLFRWLWLGLGCVWLSCSIFSEHDLTFVFFCVCYFYSTSLIILTIIWYCGSTVGYPLCWYKFNPYVLTLYVLFSYSFYIISLSSSIIRLMSYLSILLYGCFNHLSFMFRHINPLTTYYILCGHLIVVFWIMRFSDLLFLSTCWSMDIFVCNFRMWTWTTLLYVKSFYLYFAWPKNEVILVM